MNCAGNFRAGNLPRQLSLSSCLHDNYIFNCFFWHSFNFWHGFNFNDLFGFLIPVLVQLQPQLLPPQQLYLRLLLLVELQLLTQTLLLLRLLSLLLYFTDATMLQVLQVLRWHRCYDRCCRCYDEQVLQELRWSFTDATNNVAGATGATMAQMP